MTTNTLTEVSHHCGDVLLAGLIDQVGGVHNIEHGSLVGDSDANRCEAVVDVVELRDVPIHVGSLECVSLPFELLLVHVSVRIVLCGLELCTEGVHALFDGPFHDGVNRSIVGCNVSSQMLLVGSKVGLGEILENLGAVQQIVAQTDVVALEFSRVLTNATSLLGDIKLTDTVNAALARSHDDANR